MKSEEQVKKAMTRAYHLKGKCMDDHDYERYLERFKTLKWVYSDDWPVWMLCGKEDEE